MRAELFLFAPLLVGASDPSYRYQLDPARSTISAKVGFFGIASKTAHFSQMAGHIAISPQRLDTIDLDVTIDARNLKAGDSLTTARLKSRDFFDVDRFPIVHFAGNQMKMTGPVTAIVQGQVTARGIARPEVVLVTFRTPPAKTNGRDPVEFSARTVIDRRNYGMTAYSAIVGKKVTITINARMTPQ